MPPTFPGRDPSTPVLRVWKFDITPDNSKLVATGNFRQVDGAPRQQIAILDLSSNPVGLTAWSTNFFRQTDPAVADQTSIAAAWCIPAFAHYIRGIDISPDGTYFAAVTTGANWLHPSCDSMSRFDLGDYTPNQQPEWVTQTGGDSFHSVLVTGAAIYGGGHQQYVNNPYNPNRCGFCTNPFAGGVARTGFSAHDPRNGMPFTWNPVRNPRGKGVLAMTSTATGFYFGSDTNNIHGLVRQKLAFMPLAGGVTQAPENPYTLPGNFYTVGQIGSPDALLRRSFDGSTFGAATSLSTGWSNVHGAFALNGRLYTGQSNGTLTVRSFNGTTAGGASALNLFGLENAPGPQYTIPGTNIPIPGLSTTLPQLTGMAIDKGFIYYTVQGDPRLYARGVHPAEPGPGRAAPGAEHRRRGELGPGPGHDDREREDVLLALGRHAERRELERRGLRSGTPDRQRHHDRRTERRRHRLVVERVLRLQLIGSTAHGRRPRRPAPVACPRSSRSGLRNRSRGHRRRLG